jgi:hypothetical protein
MVVIILATVFVAGLVYKRYTKRRAQKRVRMFLFSILLKCLTPHLFFLGHQISCLESCHQKSSGRDRRDSPG